MLIPSSDTVILLPLRDIVARVGDVFEVSIDEGDLQPVKVTGLDPIFVTFDQTVDGRTFDLSRVRVRLAKGVELKTRVVRPGLFGKSNISKTYFPEGTKCIVRILAGEQGTPRVYLFNQKIVTVDSYSEDGEHVILSGVVYPVSSVYDPIVLEDTRDHPTGTRAVIKFKSDPRSQYVVEYGKWGKDDLHIRLIFTREPLKNYSIQTRKDKFDVIEVLQVGKGNERIPGRTGVIRMKEPDKLDTIPVEYLDLSEGDEITIVEDYMDDTIPPDLEPVIVGYADKAANQLDLHYVNSGNSVRVTYCGFNVLRSSVRPAAIIRTRVETETVDHPKEGSPVEKNDKRHDDVGEPSDLEFEPLLKFKDTLTSNDTFRMIHPLGDSLVRVMFVDRWKLYVDLALVEDPKIDIGRRYIADVKIMPGSYIADGTALEVPDQTGDDTVEPEFLSPQEIYPVGSRIKFRSRKMRPGQQCYGILTGVIKQWDFTNSPFTLNIEIEGASRYPVQVFYFSEIEILEVIPDGKALELSDQTGDVDAEPAVLNPEEQYPVGTRVVFKTKEPIPQYDKIGTVFSWQYMGDVLTITFVDIKLFNRANGKQIETVPRGTFDCKNVEIIEVLQERPKNPDPKFAKPDIADDLLFHMNKVKAIAGLQGLKVTIQFE